MASRGLQQDAGAARFVLQIRHIVKLLLHCSLDEIVAEVDLGRRQGADSGGEAEVAPHDCGSRLMNQS